MKKEQFYFRFNKNFCEIMLLFFNGNIETLLLTVLIFCFGGCKRLTRIN